MRRHVGAVVLAALLSACSAAPERRDLSWQIPSAEERTALETPVTCYGADECSRAWRKATVWITQNSAWKIRLATDSLLETFGPTRSDLELAYRLTRRPLGQDVDEIVLEAFCGQVGYICRPIATPEIARARFAMYMRKD